MQMEQSLKRCRISKEKAMKICITKRLGSDLNGRDQDEKERKDPC
jgi:hypothetical protein